MQGLSSYKVIGGLLGTIFLGALGSGAWEEIVKPIIQFIGFWIVKIMSYLFSSYRDNVYLEISNGFHEYPSLQLFMALLSLLATLYYIMIKKHPYNRNDKKLEKNKKSFLSGYKGYITLYFISTFIIVFIIIMAAQASYVNKMVTYSMKSINIVSPYISENEILLLKSNFSSIESAEDFYNFRKKLIKIEKDYNLKLPEVMIF